MIPKTVKSIGDDAFKDSALRKIAVEDGCQADVKNMVGDDVIVQTVYEVKIPAGTEIITDGQFEGQNIYRIFIPKSVEEIQDNAFKKCRNLKEVVFEAGSVLNKIGV